MAKIQVEILGLSNAPNTHGAFALILKEIKGKRQLPIIIGSFEAQSIAAELENLPPHRPLTHDLISNILDELDITLEEVFINELKDGTFYSILKFEVGGENIEIDSRPSDAIAIAVRTDAPIFVEEDILNEAGIVMELPEKNDFSPSENVNDNIKDIITKIESFPRTKLEKLQLLLTKSIEDEDYERAANIRDEIKKITQNS